MNHLPWQHTVSSSVSWRPAAAAWMKWKFYESSSSSASAGPNVLCTMTATWIRLMENGSSSVYVGWYLGIHLMHGVKTHGRENKTREQEEQGDTDVQESINYILGVPHQSSKNEAATRDRSLQVGQNHLHLGRLTSLRPNTSEPKAAVPTRTSVTPHTSPNTKARNDMSTMRRGIAKGTVTGKRRTSHIEIA